MIAFKILKDQKIDIDLIDNPEGLPYVDLIVRDQHSGRITGWHSLGKEHVVAVIKELQRMVVKL